MLSFNQDSGWQRSRAPSCLSHPLATPNDPSCMTPVVAGLGLAPSLEEFDHGACDL